MHFKIKSQERLCMGKCNEPYRNTFCRPLSQVRFVKNVTSWKEMKPGFYHGHISYLDFAKYVPWRYPQRGRAAAPSSARSRQRSWVKPRTALPKGPLGAGSAPISLVLLHDNMEPSLIFKKKPHLIYWD